MLPNFEESAQIFQLNPLIKGVILFAYITAERTMLQLQTVFFIVYSNFDVEII